MYYALCQMPMPSPSADDVLYNDSDGRELDERARSFAESCYRAICETGYLESLEGATVLDVGCGVGYLLSMFPALIRFGIDPNPIASKYARDDVCVFNGTMESITQLFDIVMSWHVLEHVADPPQFVKDMAKRTRKDGLVFIATPNADSIMAKSKHWRCREPFHRYLLGRGLLRELMRDAGLGIEKELTWGGFPAPRSILQELGNKMLKLLGHGDVQLIIARKL